MVQKWSAQKLQTALMGPGRLFASVDTAALEAISKCIRLMSVPSGRLILQQGESSTGVFFMLSGTAVGQLAAESGRQVLFTEIGVGDHFGELAALDGSERSITISATSDCEVGVLPQADFLAAIKQHPQIGIGLAIKLAKQLRAMNERVFSLVVHDVETRVGQRVMQLAQQQEQLVEGGTISDAPTHEVMAGFIGSNREAVSRTIARLNKAGVIQTNRKQIIIEDLGRLLNIATP